MKSFLLKTIGVTVVLAVAGGVVLGVFLPLHYSPVFPFLLLFAFCFTIISYHFQAGRIKNKFSEFTRIHMVVTLIRLFSYSAIVVGYLLFSGKNIVSFVVIIALLYIIYTFLETRELTIISSDKSK